MTLEEVKKMHADYKHLKNTKINNKKVSALIILQKDADLLSIGQGAQQYIRGGNILPISVHQEYELYLLFDLDRWLSGQLPLDWMLLSKHLKK